MKRLPIASILLFLTIFLLFPAFTSCVGSSNDGIKELTQEQLDSIAKAQEDSLLYAAEQQRIQDSIKHVMDSIQAIRERELHIDRINRLLKECEVSSFYDVKSFNDNRRTIERAIRNETDPALKKKWTNALKSVQIRNFPKARKYYIQTTKNEMWDLDVNVYGSGTTITFVSYMFATNSNIDLAYQSVKSALQDLRFKRVNFKWSEYGEYTYYTISSLSDGTVE